MKKWDRIMQDHLKKLNAMTNVYLEDLASSIPNARLDMWYGLNEPAYSKSQAR